MVACRLDVAEKGQTERRAARLIVARGPRAVEARLLADVGELAAQARRAPELLSRPVRVVVPSVSLRRHVSARLVAGGVAVAGVEVQTLYGLAAGVLQCAGEPPPPGSTLLPLLVARVAARAPTLRAALGGVRDGYAALVETVRDLLDTGMTADHLDALEDVLCELPPAVATERALAVVRVAASVATALRAGAMGRPADVLRRAAELLATDPEVMLPSRAVLVHGFAEATGVASDLLEMLARACRACTYLDEPPDPVEPRRQDSGVEFARRLRERLLGVAGRPLELGAVEGEGPVLTLVRAPGSGAEAREVAARIRELLDAGTRPEGIGIVARQPDGYSAVLEQHLSRLVVPFSCVGVKGSWGPHAPALAGLRELLRRGSGASVDAWLGAMRWPEEEDRADLRLGLRAAGAARLSDVADLDADDLLGDADALPLPLRQGISSVAGNGGEEGEETVLPRRRLRAALLRAAIARAARLLASLQAWRSEGPLGRYLVGVRRAASKELGWRGEGGPGAILEAALGDLDRDAPTRLSVTREEALLLVEQALGDAAREAPGGRGGGVQVLGVTEARAMTFEHLFVLGLNRDVFPRQVSEDPLLPDTLRTALLPVLPDLPVKSRGYAEERYLFAQLAAASPRVTLSWQTVDDDGRARPPSPLVERLRLAVGAPGIEAAPDLYAPLKPDSPRVRPPHEHAVLAGLHADRRTLAEVLPMALPGALDEAAQVAAVRLRVVSELDPDLDTADGRARDRALGPYFGFIGTAGAPDSRAGIAVTTLEGMARCPWQAFLRTVLRLELAPDPLASLPDVDPTTLGMAVHRVLEAIVRSADDGLATTVEGALHRAPLPVRWPEPARLEPLVAGAVRAVAKEQGLALPGLRHVLLQRLRPYLEVARELLFRDGLLATGTEASGEFVVEAAGDGTRRLSFRADLVERTAEGVRFTDYKTGRPVSTAKRAETLHRHLVAAARSGERLQAGAYVLSVPEERVEGRYACLRPPLEAYERAARLAGTDHHDVELLGAVRAAVGTLLMAWEEGVFFPRLTEADRNETPRACAHCEVRSACLQDDSGARRRLLRWANLAERRHDLAEEALLGVWDLRRKGGEEAS